jgi:hypothetical protein
MKKDLLDPDPRLVANERVADPSASSVALLLAAR